MSEGTHGYPFFLQELGYCAWNVAEGKTITVADVRLAHAETIHELDKGFFRVRLDRLTPKEIAFVEAMASLGSGPCRIGEIAKVVNNP